MTRNFLAAVALVALSTAAVSRSDTASFDLDSGRPMVQLKVNGQGPFPFVLDTGSPALLVMRSLADQLGLQVIGNEELSSPIGGTPLEVDVVQVESIALGDASVGGLEAIVVDMEGHGLGMGVVGPALFRDHGVTTIDFEQNTIVFGDVSPGVVTTWIPFGDSAPLLDVPVQIGDVVIEGHLDTGSPGRVVLPYDLQDQLPLSGPVRTIGRARTVDAEFDIRSAPIDASVSIGDAEVPLTQIEFSDIPVANVGTAAVRGLTLYINWQDETFALTGTADPSYAPHQPRHTTPSEGGPQRVVQVTAGKQPPFGLRARPSADGVIQVVGIDPDSAAEALDLQAGDRIVAVNGKSPRDLDHAEIRAELADPNLVLTVERGDETLRIERTTGSGD